MILINDRVVGVIDEVSVANDKEVVRLEFRCKNQVTELFRLTDSTVFINYQNGSTKDRYAVTDLTQDGEYVNFSWTLGANATKKQGKTFFVVCAVITEDEDVQQEWNTELAFFNVNKGLECETQPSEDMEDLFAQLTAMVEENASDITALEGSKQDKLIAGDNITIQGNVISASSSVDAYTKAETDALLDEKQDVLTAGAGISISEQNVISATAGINIEVVQALPSTGDTQTIYLVPNSGSAPNIYDEYIYVNNAWEKIGTTDVDLSNYYTKTETNTLLNAKADASALASKLDKNQGSANVGKVMTVGNDGSLTPQTAQGTTYTAGQNISISAQNVISAGIEVIEI